MPNNSPYRIPIILYKFSLLSEIKKHDTPTAALQQLALATINKRYPAEEYLRIYTDGSLSKMDGKAGAGIYSELFSYYISVGSNRTSFNGETATITNAMQQLLLRTTTFKKLSSSWTLKPPSKQ